MEKLKHYLITLLDQFIEPHCTQELFINHKLFPFNTLDSYCTQLFIRKGLSFGIIGGSALVKLPQLFKILLNQSVSGLSLIGQVLELVSSTIAFVYNFKAGNSFMVYGETFFVSVQNGLLVLMIGFYGNKMMQLILFTAIYSVLLSTLLVPNYVSNDQMAILQVTTIPITALARIPQILQVWSSRSTGQLSSISLFLIMAGSLARLYTTAAEVKDPILLFAHSITALLNTILFLQVIFVGKARKKVSEEKKKN